MDDDAELLADERGPERTCIVTRSKGDPSGMIRFVVAPDGVVVPDIRARLPGRGAWVTGAAEVVAVALKRKAFARAFRREVATDGALVEQVGDLLARDALQALALANKAGLVVAGAFKVEAAVKAAGVAVLLHATEASPDGVRKIEALARHQRGATGGTRTLQIFASHQLDLALGRANVIHAALSAGGASTAFLERALRLQGYRDSRQLDRAGDSPGSTPS